MLDSPVSGSKPWVPGHPPRSQRRDLGHRAAYWVTVKLRLTGGAAKYSSFPACVALMVQVPDAIKEAVFSATVQAVGVVEAKLTPRPELAVAESVSVVPAVCEGMAAKVMVWVAWATPKLCLAEAAK